MVSDHADQTTCDLDESFKYDPKTGDIIFQKKILTEDSNSCARGVAFLQGSLTEFYRRTKRLIRKAIGFILFVLILAYVIFSLMRSGLNDESSIRLLVCTLIGIALLMKHFGQRQLKPVYKAASSFNTSPKYLKLRSWISWSLYIVSTVMTVTLIIVLVAIDKPRNLLSLAGLGALMLICYLLSYNPAMIEIRPVFWGFSVQFYFAVIILKTRWGFEIFNWMGDRVTEFMVYSEEGAKFVFGDVGNLSFQDGTTLRIKSVSNSNGSIFPISSVTLADQSTVTLTAIYSIHFFAFKVLPIVIFFSAFIGIISYLGVMSFVVKNIGRFLSFCLGTTPAESLNAAGNIFIGMTESPLMIRAYIGKMTSSELHAVMTGGFATISGSVLGVYIGFGVPADHLLSASVMSAPAALAISKMMYPEVEIPLINSQSYDKVKNSNDSNIIEAACNNAVIAGKVCAAIIVNIVAFLSLLKFVNATLSWLGERAGVNDLSFELICSYVLYPVALCMGVSINDCHKMAELIGVKTFTNEFVAFSKLSALINNRKIFEKYIQNPNNTWYQDGDDIFLPALDDKKLEKGFLEPRTEVIATYALCGFSNFASVGILLGGLSAMAPHRTSTMSRLIFRAMIAGNIACFFTACIAGLFYEEFTEH